MRGRRRNGSGTLRVAMLLSMLVALTSRSPAEGLPIKVYTAADGLAHNRINRIVRDSRGFLWFCTADGLSRFDGSRFTNYNVEDGLPSTSINDLLETQSGVYWVATNGGGIARMNSVATTDASARGQPHPRFTGLPISSEPVTNRVNVLFEDRAGALWAGTDGGLFRMNSPGAESEFHLVELQIPSHPDLSVQVWAVIGASDGGLWIATKFGLVHRLADGRILHYEIQPGKTGDSVWSLLSDSDGKLWLAHDSGVIAFKPQPDLEQGERPIEVLKIPNARRYLTGIGPDIHARALFRSSTGQIWASDTGQGLTVFDGTGFKPYPMKQFPVTPFSIAEDRNGDLWLGTPGNGALRLAMTGFTTYDKDDGVGPVIGSVFEGSDGNLYVVSRWRISRFDGKKFASVNLNLPRAVTETDWRANRNVLEDRAGDWWIGTRVGLFRFEKGFERLGTARAKAAYTRKDGLADDDITRLFEDSRGDIWIAGFATGRDVVTRWDRATGIFHRYSEADGLRPYTTPNAFCEDRSGNLWIGFREGGLARYRAGHFTMFTEGEGIPAGSIRDLYLDQSGRLWFSQTQVGALYRIDDTDATPPPLVAYTKHDGLNSHRLGCIVGDTARRIYVDNSRGIDQLDPDTRQVRHYTSTDGLAPGEMICALLDRLGNLWFGTTRGLMRLAPQARDDDAPPPILIDQLHIGGNEYFVSSLGENAVTDLEIEPNQDQIEISFFGFSFGVGESLRFQYKLEGSSSDWSVPTELRSVNYANLAPGSYRFVVRAVGATGAASERPATVAFRVLPPVWRRWWFLVLTAALVSAVVVAFTRSRIARLRAVSDSEKRFRTLAETASDAIITIDENSRIVYVNHEVERVFGYDQQQMLGEDLTMLMPEYLRALHRAGFSRYQQTGKRHISWHAIELPGLHKSGREIPLELSFGEFTKDDRRFFTGIARDITERKRAEEELRRSREERLAELERVRRRIATDLHDDIGSSLTQISLLSEVMRTRIDPGNASLAEPLKMIAGTSRELVDAMSDIVWAINPRKDHLSDLLLRMRRFASDVFTARNIRFQFNEPEEEQDIRLGANIRREVFLIFKESVNNLVRHSGCTEANIDFQIADSRLSLEIRDNGKGFDPDQLADGHGLTSMRLRASDIGGQIDINARAGGGTTISLQVTLAHADSDSGTTQQRNERAASRG